MSDETSTLVFGTADMNDRAADISDLAGTLQQAAIATNAFPEDAVENMVVQLTANVGDCIAGHFYRLKKVSGELKWVDITAYCTKSTTIGDSSVIIYSDCAEFTWSNPTVNENNSPWVKTMIYLVDDPESPSEESVVYTTTNPADGDIDGEDTLYVTLDDDNLEDSEIHFVIEYWFADGTHSRSAMEELPIP